MTYNRKKSIKILVLIVLLFIILMITGVHIEIPYQISTYSEVFPKEKWLLTRGNGGQIISNVINYVQGYTTHYDISQFERGEYVSLELSKFLHNKKEFNKGDTIVVLQSTNVRDQIITAEGELKVAMASLKSQSSAQKEALIKESESRLRYTEEKINEQKILNERAEQLYQKGYSSREEYELKKWTLDLLEIERDVYKAQLENLKTGVKPEDVHLLESQINSLAERLSFLKQRESQLILVAPIKGVLVSSFSPDTLLYIADYSEVVLHVPVKLSDLSEISEGEEIETAFQEMGVTYYCKVVGIGSEVKLMNDQQVVFISLLIGNPGKKLLPGTIIQSTLRLKNISIYDYILRLFF